MSDANLGTASVEVELDTKKLNSSLSRLSSTVKGGLTTSIDQVGDSFRRMGTDGSTASQKASKGLKEVESDADRAGDASGRLGASLGKLGAIGAGIAAAVGVGALAAEVTRVASNAQTTEASLTALYGAAGAGAEEVTILMEEMNERFIGLDMTTMREGATALAYMGVQGEDAVNVLENLEKATTATGSGAEGMSSAFDALTKGVNAGAFQMDTLNQISDAGIPIFDALADVLGVDIPEAQEMASEGAIGLEDVLKALEGESGTWFPALLEGADAVSQTFEGSWDRIKNTFVNGMSQQLEPVLDRLAPLMDGVASGMESAFAGLPSLFDNIFGVLEGSEAPMNGFVAAIAQGVGTFQDLFESVKPLVPVLLDGLGTALETIGPLFGIWASLAATAAEAIAPLIEKLVSGLMPVFEALAPAILSIVEAIAPLIEQFIEVAIVALEPLIDVFLLLIEAVMPLIPVIVSLVEAIAPIIEIVLSALGPIIELGAAILEWIAVNAVIPVIEEVIAIVMEIIVATTEVLEGIANFITDAIDWFKSLPGQINLAIKGLVSLVTGIFADVKNAVLDTVSLLVGDVTDFFKNLPGDIIDALGDLSSTLVDMGRDLIQGLINGVKEMASSVADAAMDAVRGAVDGVKGFLGISSPSKLFEQYGKWVGEGMVMGLDSMEGAVERAGEGLAVASTAAFDDPRGIGGDALSGATRNRSGGLQTADAGRGVNLAPGAIVVNEVGDGSATAERVIRRLVAQGGALA